MASEEKVGGKDKDVPLWTEVVGKSRTQFIGYHYQARALTKPLGRIVLVTKRMCTS